MKKIILSVLTFLIAQSVYAQEKANVMSYTTKTNGVKKIAFVVSGSNLDIEAHDGGEIIIEAKGYEKPPERAKGLKPLYNSAIDNTGIGLEVKKEGSEMIIKKASSKNNTDYKIKIPKSMSISIDETTWNGQYFNITGTRGEIEIKAKSSHIKLLDIYGPVVAHTTGGNIEVVYAKVTPDQPNSISATSGYLDVTLPKNVKANIHLSAISGEVYTDFTMEYEHNEDEKGRRNCCNGRNKISGMINGGGVEISLKAISSNIYLRQAK